MAPERPIASSEDIATAARRITAKAFTIDGEAVARRFVAIRQAAPTGGCTHPR
jgi:hypothetical protein